MKVFVVALLITIAVAVLALAFELMRSITFSRISGIELAAGGFSSTFVVFMTLGLPVLFLVVYLVVRKKF